MHLDQLETILVGTSSIDRLSSIVQAERANIAHEGSTGGNSLVDVTKSDLSKCPTCPLSEKSRAQVRMIPRFYACHMFFQSTVSHSHFN